MSVSKFEWECMSECECLSANVCEGDEVCGSEWERECLSE